MVKKVFAVHGWEGSPDKNWFPWIKKELESKGFEVHVLEMPNPEKPEIKSWIGKLGESVGEVGEKTYFVGHSIGCQTIVRYLDSLENNVRVGGALFVAGWFHLNGLEEEGEESVEIARPWLETPIDFDKVKSRIGTLTAIFSNNDPFVPVSDADLFKEKLGAKILIENDKGHFFDKEYDFILEEFLKIAE